MCMQQMSSTIFQRAHSLKKIYVMYLHRVRCNRWFYYRCVGFNETPSSDTVIDGKICNFNTISEIAKRRPFWQRGLAIKTLNPLKLHQEIGQ